MLHLVMKRYMSGYHIPPTCCAKRQLQSGPRTRGAVVVEFAVVLPVFILLIMGMMEYGRMIMVQQLLVNASREGARHATLDGATTFSVIARVNSYLDNAGVSGAQITVAPNPASAASATAITVDASIPFADVSWLPSPMFLGTTNLQTSSVMLRE